MDIEIPGAPKETLDPRQKYRVLPCATYHSKTVRRELVAMPDGKSAFKVYWVSIIGRDAPERYEWDAGPMRSADFVPRFLGSGLVGVGFVTAFPHIVKVFRFAAAAETVLDVRAFSTPDFSPLSLNRQDEFVEFACFAEAGIAADEYRAWAAAATVEEYLRYLSPFEDGPIRHHRKLGDYWASPGVDQEGGGHHHVDHRSGRVHQRGAECMTGFLPRTSTTR